MNRMTHLGYSTPRYSWITSTISRALYIVKKNTIPQQRSRKAIKKDRTGKTPHIFLSEKYTIKIYHYLFVKNYFKFGILNTTLHVYTY